MTDGKELAAELRKGKSGGIPWSVIVDGDGNQLITGDGPEGNIGCPVQPAEVAHFVDMVRQTARHLSDEDQAVIAAELQKFADGILAARKR